MRVLSPECGGLFACRQKEGGEAEGEKGGDGGFGDDGDAEGEAGGVQLKFKVQSAKCKVKS